MISPKTDHSSKLNYTKQFCYYISLSIKYCVTFSVKTEVRKLFWSGPLAEISNSDFKLENN